MSSASGTAVKPWLNCGIREPWIFIAALALQVTVIKVFRAPSTALVAGLLALTYVLVLIGVVRNRRRWSMRIIGAGVILNVIAMAANGGLMPVSPQTVVQAGLEYRIADVQVGEYVPGTKGILAAAPDIHLRWLTDSIAVRQIRRALSPGDLVIGLGFLVFLVGILWRRLLSINASAAGNDGKAWLAAWRR